jgi:WD40 repeat protein
LAYAANGRTIFFGDGGGVVQSWNLATGAQSVIFEDKDDNFRFQRPVSCLAASADGHWLAVACSRRFLCRVGPIPASNATLTPVFVDREYDARTVIAPGWTAVDLSSFGEMAFSPDSGFLAGSEWKQSHGFGRFCIKLWQTETGRQAGELGWRDHGLLNAAFSADGKTVATLARGVGNDHRILLWDLVRRSYTELAPADRESRAHYSPDGRWLVVSQAAAVEVYEVRPKKPVRVAELPNPKGKLARLMAFSPDGSRLLTGARDRAVYLWAVESHKLLADWDWRVGEVTAVAFAPDGMTAAAAGKGEQVVVWDLDPSI